MAPPGATSSFATAVSGSNVVGFYSTSSSSASYIYTGSGYTILSVAGGNGTAASAISGNKVAGTYNVGFTPHGFVYNGTSYTTFDFPTGSTNPNVTGVSGDNVVGSYDQGTNLIGFVYNTKNSTYTTLQGPGGSNYVVVYGVDGNTVVGRYVDSTNHSHGFEYQIAAIPEPSSLMLGTLATLAVSGCAWRNRKKRSHAAEIAAAT